MGYKITGHVLDSVCPIFQSPEKMTAFFRYQNAVSDVCVRYALILFYHGVCCDFF